VAARYSVKTFGRNPLGFAWTVQHALVCQWAVSLHSMIIAFGEFATYITPLYTVERCRQARMVKTLLYHRVHRPKEKTVSDVPGLVVLRVKTGNPVPRP